MKLREILQWLSKLLPKQKMQDLGDGNVQAGRVDGDLNSTQNTTNQTIYNIVVVSAENAPAEEIPKAIPSSFATPKLAPAALPKRPSETTPSQRDLLRLMALNPANEARAVVFMRREFSTDRVKKLTTFECLRTTRYLEACIQREAAQRA